MSVEVTLEEWARAFLATHVIEVPIVLGWLRARLGWSALGWGLLASTLSHPLLWLALAHLRPWRLWIGPLELWVALFEGAIYAFALRRREGRWGWRAGLGVSLLANASSFVTGLLIG